MEPQIPSSSHWWSRTRLVRGVLTVFIIGAALAFLVVRSAPELLTNPLVHATPTAKIFRTTTATLFPREAIDLLSTRPLHLPTLASGSPCPTVPGRTVNSTNGPALGDGPVYLVSLGTDQGNVEYAPAKNFGSQEWGGQKTIYAISPDYQGWVLLRGHQLDGPNEVRFGEGDVPHDMEVWNASPFYTDNHWTFAGDYTRMRAPGCYAVQADGTSFSEVIIFQAAPY